MAQPSEPVVADEQLGFARADAPLQAQLAPPLTAANVQVSDRLALGLVALVAAGVACFWSGDGDLGFHLATGREVLATGQIPARNVLSFAEPEHVWQLHQWLPGVLFELLHRAFGIGAVVTLKMAVIAVTWCVVYRAARHAGAAPASSALACLLGIAASAFRFEARPYIFTHLTLALIILACASYTRALRSRTSNGWGACAAAGGVAALGCQLHAGALDGFIALSVFAAGVAIEPLRARFSNAAPQQPAGMRNAARLGVAALGGALVGALLLRSYHPLGARILLFPFEMASDSYLAEHLVEFRRPWAFPLPALAGYWLLLALWAASSLARVRVIHAAWLALGLVFALLSLRFVRMAFAFSIVAVPTLALVFDHTRAAVALRMRPRLAVLTLSALALAVPLYTFRDRTPGFGYAPSVWPLAHFDFIRAHNLQGNAFVSDAWAGPFLGQFYPERRVFFDNRMEAYSQSFMRDVYQRIRYAEPGWDQLLDRYAIQIVLMRYTSEGERRLQHAAPNLRQLLTRDPRFSLVRFDDVGELFVRRHGPNAELARQLALPGIDPDRHRFTVDPRSAGESLLRALQRGERSATLLGMAALAFAARGQPEQARDLAREAVRLAPDDAWAGHVATQLKAAE